MNLVEKFCIVGEIKTLDPGVCRDDVSKASGIKLVRCLKMLSTSKSSSRRKPGSSVVRYVSTDFENEIETETEKN